MKIIVGFIGNWNMSERYEIFKLKFQIVKSADPSISQLPE